MGKAGFRFKGNLRFRKRKGAAGDRYTLAPNTETAGLPLTFDTLDLFVPGRIKTVSAIETVGAQMKAMDADGYEHVAAVAVAMNAGRWAGARDDVLHTLHGIGVAQGHDEDLHEKAHRVHADSYDQLADKVMPAEWYKTLACADDAATALAHRHLIDEVRGWDKDAYDTLTRPWRAVFGPVHPEDSRSTPESSLRQPLASVDGFGFERRLASA